MDSKGSASSASSLRSSVAGLPEVSSISFIFNGYSEGTRNSLGKALRGCERGLAGLNIVEATLRFDIEDLQKGGEPARVPQMRPQTARTRDLEAENEGKPWKFGGIR